MGVDQGSSHREKESHLGLCGLWCLWEHCSGLVLVANETTIVDNEGVIGSQLPSLEGMFAEKGAAQPRKWCPLTRDTKMLCICFPPPPARSLSLYPHYTKGISNFCLKLPLPRVPQIRALQPPPHFSGIEYICPITPFLQAWGTFPASVLLSPLQPSCLEEAS